MQLNVPPDLEALIEQRLATGDYENAEDVVRRAVQAQDAQYEEEDWTEEEKAAISARLEEICRQADRDEVFTLEQVRREMEAHKARWRQEHSLKR
jgi:Arc/MetJ-type ribon-helix-helix transcriptional regulator